MTTRNIPKFEDTMPAASVTKAPKEKAVPKFEDTVEAAPRAIPTFEDTQEITETSQAEAALKGAAQGAMFGWYDEAMGGFNAGLETVKQAVGPEVANSKSFIETYEKERDIVRANLDKLEKEHGKTFLAGQIAGGIATSLIPVGLAAKGVGAVAKAAQMARGVGNVKKLALAGAVAGAGESEDDDLADVAKDAAFGAATGAALGGIGKGLGEYARYILSSKKVSTLKSMGFGKRKIEDLGPDKQAELLKFASKSGILSVDKAKTSTNANKLIEEMGEKLDAVFDKAKDEGVRMIDKKALVNKLKTELLPKHDNESTRKTAKFIQELIKDAERVGETPQSARNLRKLFGEHTAQKIGRDAAAAKDAFRLLADNMDEAIDKSTAGMKTEGLKDLMKSTYRDFSFTHELARASKRAAAQADNDPMALTKLIKNPLRLFQTAAIATHSPIIGGAKLVFDVVEDRLGPIAAVKATNIIQKGGNLAKSLTQAIQKGQLDTVASMLAGEKVVDMTGNDKKQQTLNLIKQLKQPK